MLTDFSAGGLECLLRAQPISLRRLVFDHRRNAALTGEDYLEFLEFLAHPECKLQYVSGYNLLQQPLLRFLSVSAARDVQERLKDPVGSLNNVLRDKNCTLTCFPVERHENEIEVKFWCRMNQTCPNRLQLRQRLSDAYADQIAKYLNGNSHSEAFELVRSTFHLWAR